jgi:hypothetical protein
MQYIVGHTRNLDTYGDVKVGAVVRQMSMCSVKQPARVQGIRRDISLSPPLKASSTGQEIRRLHS